MSHNLNSLKCFLGDYRGDYYRDYTGDTRSLDYCSYEKDRIPLGSTPRTPPGVGAHRRVLGAETQRG